MVTSLLDKSRRQETLTDEFYKAYGKQPSRWSRAPGRVDLMGSHTDYNMGFVMTMTTDRDTWIAARPRSDRQVRVRSLNISGESLFRLDDLTQDVVTPWSNYVRGMAFVLQEAGHELTGFDGLIHSTVPFGSGLSSSAAIEMATAVMFQQLSGLTLDPVEMALLGQKAENEFVGVNTGILDQYSSAMGQEGNALQLDCRELTSEDVSIAGGLRVVICDTRAERNLVGSEYDDRRAECEKGVSILQGQDPTIRALRDVTIDQFVVSEGKMPVVVAKRCRFIIEENQRVLDLGPALTSGDENALRDLFEASYSGARDLFEIGAPAMEAMMQAMRGGPGFVAARQAGAGFGGCMVALVKEGSVAGFCEHVEQDYTSKTGIQPRTFPVTASQGAGVLFAQ
jgi:galactokinase